MVAVGSGRKEGRSGEEIVWLGGRCSVLSADEDTRSNNSGTISLFHHAPFLIFSRQHPLLSVGDLSIHIHTSPLPQNGRSTQALTYSRGTGRL